MLYGHKLADPALMWIRLNIVRRIMMHPLNTSTANEVFVFFSINV